MNPMRMGCSFSVHGSLVLLDEQVSISSFDSKAKECHSWIRGCELAFYIMPPSSLVIHVGIVALTGNDGNIRLDITRISLVEL